MYDIDTKNVKAGAKMYIIFLIIGIAFLIIMIGILVGSIMKAKQLDSTVTSTRVEVNSHIDDEGTTMYSPIYYYEVDGRTYQCGSNISTNHNPGTDNKIVYYDSTDPSNCMTEYTKSNNWMLLLFAILPAIFITIGVLNIVKVNKRLKVIKELNQKGKLVKNLAYRMENTGIRVNHAEILRPVVDYTLPSGTTITLQGDPRMDKKVMDADGMVDIVIDETNPNNYFIDFEINRLSGNLPQDYYNQSSTLSSSNTQPPITQYYNQDYSQAGNNIYRQ